LVLAAIGNPVELGSGNNVVSLGRISDERIMSFAYSAADLFVFPTRAESFGQVVMEAMACGTPTVSFDVGGVPDMVRPGVTGLLAKAEDPASLREAIVAILNDKERRERMTKQCRDIAVREYGLEVQARNYQKLYEELVPK
jgi:glycosyltransferase involved in cell wall biosynthesis